MSSNPSADAGIANSDETLEQMIRDSRYRSWDPWWHVRIYEYWAELAAALQQQAKIDFFVAFGLAPGIFETNLTNPGETPYAYDLDGIGLEITAQIVLPTTTPGIPVEYRGLDFRRLIIDHTIVQYTIKGTRDLVFHRSWDISPGPGVSGSVASTEADSDRAQSVHGVPSQKGYYRIGGPDTREVIKLRAGEKHKGAIHFDAVLVAIIQNMATLFPEEKIPGSFQLGLELKGHSRKPLA